MYTCIWVKVTRKFSQITRKILYHFDINMCVDQVHVDQYNRSYKTINMLLTKPFSFTLYRIYYYSYIILYRLIKFSSTNNCAIPHYVYIYN